MKHTRSRIPYVLLLFILLGTGSLVPVVADGSGVTAREIYQMHTDGLSERVLLEHLNLNGFAGQLTRERVQDLREANVPRSVIQHMRELQEGRYNRNDRHERNTSDDRPVKEEALERVNQEEAEKGMLKLRSRTADTVWFRVDQSSHTLYLATEDTRRFVGLSKGNRIEFPVPSGTWHVSLNRSDRARQFTISVGGGTKVVVQRRERERLVLQWFGRGAESGQRIVLNDGQQDRSKRVRERWARQTGHSDASRMRVDSRWNDGLYPSYDRRSGFHRSGYGYVWPDLRYGWVRPPRWQFHGYRGLEGIRTKRYQDLHYSRGGLFDFSLHLNHDFGTGDHHGSFHLRSGHRNLHFHSSHSD